MMRRLFGAAAAAMFLAGAASAQSSATDVQTRVNVTPVAPPATMVTRVGPGEFMVTPVPGVAMATKVRIQNFSDYDMNRDGAYSPMEFAQALYFLATSDPVAGNPKLPALDRFIHRGAPERMAPQNAVALLNATSEEFSLVDMNNDWRVTPEELAAVAMM